MMPELQRRTKCSMTIVGDADPMIYAFFNFSVSFYRLQVGSEAWERINVQNHTFYGIWVLSLWEPHSSKVIIFGGDQEMLDNDSRLSEV
jgi:hypothetical protein